MTNALSITAHYTHPDIVERILAALAPENGPDAPVTVEALAPVDHFHGRNLQATEDLARLLDPRPGEHVLDIGCGIGGPARWIAQRYGCRVTGIDLTPAFCEAARRLNEITGLADRITIVEGDATRLPFPDAAFDRAWSHNVIMNIADKARFHAEAWRVLKPGGTFVLFCVVAGPKGMPRYPAPWAETAATSFLSTPEETRRDLVAAGFKIVQLRDTTAEHLPGLVANRLRLEEKGLPKLGVHVIHGAHFKHNMVNTALSTEEGSLGTIEVLARRPR